MVRFFFPFFHFYCFVCSVLMSVYCVVEINSRRRPLLDVRAQPTPLRQTPSRQTPTTTQDYFTTTTSSSPPLSSSPTAYTYAQQAQAQIQTPYTPYPPFLQPLHHQSLPHPNNKRKRKRKRNIPTTPKPARHPAPLHDPRPLRITRRGRQYGLEGDDERVGEGFEFGE